MGVGGAGGSTGNFEKKLISCGNMFCVLVKYQDLNMLLVLIKMFRAWFLFLSVEENSTISTTKHLLHVREQMESLVSQMVFRDFAVMDSHFNCSPMEI